MEIRAPDEIAGFIEAAGRAGGLDRQAAAVAQRLRGRLASLAARYASARPLDYFYQVVVQPLYTISGQHLISRGLASVAASTSSPTSPAWPSRLRASP